MSRENIFILNLYFGRFFLMNCDINTHEWIYDRNIFRLKRTKAYEREIKKNFHLARLNIIDKNKSRQMHQP